MRHQRLFLLGLTCAWLIACAEDGTDPGAAVDVPVDTGGTGVDDVPVAPDTVIPDSNPECVVDDDCADTFSDLRACERASCAMGACERVFVAEGAECDDGDPCSTGDRCAQDPSGDLVCLPEVVGCDDGDLCNGDEVCGEAGCEAGAPLGCVDENVCNGTETCDPELGCRPGAPLTCPQDGNVCNGAEHCDPTQGCVSGTAQGCDDGSACTTDACDPVLGCVFTLDSGAAGCCASDEDCNDGNACTTATCVGGACVVQNVDGPCTPANPCAEGGQCQAGKCQATPATPCEVVCTLTGQAGDVVDCPLGLARIAEGDPAATELELSLGWQAGAAALQTLVDPYCFGETCLVAAIPQTATSLQPDDHTVYLDPSSPAAWEGALTLQIAHIPEPETPISPAYYVSDVLQGDAQLVVLRFQLAHDVSASPVVIHSVTATAPGQPLVTGLVDEVIVTAAQGCGGALCFDASPCTDDVCNGGTCELTPATGGCDDGNPCTSGDACQDGQCVPAGFVASGAACTGENLCAGEGACDGGGTCDVPAGAAVGCDDEDDPCVSITCDPVTGGCLTAPNPGVACDDGSACTTNDVCDGAGECGGAPLVCNDGFGCTVDGCDPATGCTAVPDEELCDDGNACTADTCGPGGCLYTPISGGCDDGDGCTMGDSCTGGVCVGSPDPVCGCTSDADCVALEDGNLCNGTLSCQGGTCLIQPASVVTCPADPYQCKTGWTCDPGSGECDGTPATCDDGIDCTADSCSVTDGCLNKPMDSCPIGWICQVSGATGAEVTCTIQVARSKLVDPLPSGADLTLHWDPARVRLVNFEDTLCIGAACFPYDLVGCAPDGTDCWSEDLQPSGHELVVVPHDKADWTNRVAISSYHAGQSGKPLNDAFVSAGGAVSGDALLLTARFEVLVDIPAGSPEQIEVSNVHFNPASGLEMAVTIKELNVGRSFVAKGP